MATSLSWAYNLALRRRKQEAPVSKASLGYIVRPCLKKQKQANKVLFKREKISYKQVRSELALALLPPLKESVLKRQSSAQLALEV
jgi:hypothetical protein